VQCSFVRSTHFPVYDFIGLSKQPAAFAVPQQYIVDEQVAQERSADLAREGAAAVGTEPSASVTFTIAVNGGRMTTSTSDTSPISSNSDSTNRADLACIMFIFQLAATIFLRINLSDRMNRIYKMILHRNQFGLFY
jgi:hypothetical protein